MAMNSNEACYSKLLVATPAPRCDFSPLQTSDPPNFGVSTNDQFMWFCLRIIWNPLFCSLEMLNEGRNPTICRPGSFERHPKARLKPPQWQTIPAFPLQDRLDKRLGVLSVASRSQAADQCDADQPVEQILGLFSILLSWLQTEYGGRVTCGGQHTWVGFWVLPLQIKNPKRGGPQK